MKKMAKEKTFRRVLYEELRLLLKDTPEAIMRLRKICVDKTTHYIIINDHIGDVVISLGYLKAYRDKNNLTDVTLVVNDKFEMMSEQYKDDYEHLILMPAYSLKRVFLINLTRYGLYVLEKKYPNVTLINPADAAMLGFDYFRKYPKVNLLELIRDGCYSLGNNACFRSMKSKCKETERNVKRIVLLEPCARTVRNVNKDLLLKLVPFFKEMKYEVYTNTDLHSDCIEGTKVSFVPLESVGDFVGSGIFIGTRCGLHDYLMYQECSVIAIYPKKYRYSRLFDLGMLPNTKARYLEIEESENVKDNIEMIVDFLRNNTNEND